MKQSSALKYSPGIEMALPLVFFSNETLGYAALLILCSAALTLILLELLRFQPRTAIAALYLFWLAALGGIGWQAFKIAPYWIWGVHLLVPPAAWFPTDLQRAKPFLFGFKKYFKKRFQEWLGALMLFIFFGGAVFFIRKNWQGPECWVFAAAVLIYLEVFISKWKKRAL